MTFGPRMKIVSIMVVAIIIIASTGVFAYFYFSEITALEGREKADARAELILPGSSLYVLGNNGKLHNNGKSTAWEYRYFIPKDDGYRMIIVYVHGNGNVDNSIIGEFSLDSVYDDYEPIVNWTMDSPEAIELALQNVTIKEFLEKYPNSLEGMGLGVISSIPGNDSAEIILPGPTLIWGIGWQYLGPNEDNHYAQIKINEANGESLYVHADI